MRTNNISVLPGPGSWKSSNIRELMFSHNCIKDLDLSEATDAWARLEKLHLSGNKLNEVQHNAQDKNNRLEKWANLSLLCCFGSDPPTNWLVGRPNLSGCES